MAKKRRNHKNKRLCNPHEYYVDLTRKLLEQKKTLIREAKSHSVSLLGYGFGNEEEENNEKGKSLTRSLTNA